MLAASSDLFLMVAGFSQFSPRGIFTSPVPIPNCGKHQKPTKGPIEAPVLWRECIVLIQYQLNGSTRLRELALVARGSQDARSPNLKYSPFSWIM